MGELVFCLLCDEETVLMYTCFLVDQEGRRRYGSVCPECYKEAGLDVPSNLRKKETCGTCGWQDMGVMCDNSKSGVKLVTRDLQACEHWKKGRQR